MRLIGSVLLLFAYIVASNAWLTPVYYYVRIRGSVLCDGRPTDYAAEVMEADDSEVTHDHVKRFRTKGSPWPSLFDVRAKDEERTWYGENLVPDFFIRVHNKGHCCSKFQHYDTPFIPRKGLYESEEEAEENPIDIGTIDLANICNVA